MCGMRVSCLYRYILGIHGGQRFRLIYVVHGICVLPEYGSNEAEYRAVKEWLLS
jgi:hypothetical protein